MCRRLSGCWPGRAWWWIHWESRRTALGSKGLGLPSNPVALYRAHGWLPALVDLFLRMRCADSWELPHGSCVSVKAAGLCPPSGERHPQSMFTLQASFAPLSNTSELSVAVLLD